MAIFFDAPVIPDALTAFVRNVPVSNQSTPLLSMFPSTTTQNNEIDLSQLTKLNGTAAFRSFDGRIHVADRQPASGGRLKLPAISDSLNQGEYERLQIEFARTGGSREQALVDAIYDDGGILARNVQNRLELAVGDVLADGVLSIDDDDFKATVDYGVPASNKPTAGTLWTNAAADILGDLTSWVDTYVDENGFVPDSLLLSRQRVRNMLTNDAIIAAVAGAQTGRTRVTLAELEELLDSEGLPANIVTYDNQYDVDGTATRGFPANKVAFLPPNLGDLITVVHGISATALELAQSQEADFSMSDAPGTVAVVIKEGPPFRQFVFVDGVAIPALQNANRLFAATIA